MDVRREPIWTQVKDTFGALGFGTFGDLPIKVLWCLGGLTPRVLAASGSVIWLSRRRGRRHAPPAKRRHSDMPPSVRAA